MSVYSDKRNGKKYRVENGHMVYLDREEISKRLGRKLTNDDIVVHLNGVNDDNREENVVIVSRRTQHTKHEVERILQKRIRDLEDLIEHFRWNKLHE